MIQRSLKDNVSQKSIIQKGRGLLRAAPSILLELSFDLSNFGEVWDRAVLILGRMLRKDTYGERTAGDGAVAAHHPGPVAP